MKVLELFAGTRSIGKAFEAAGHEVFSIEWDKNFEDIDMYADINKVTAQDILDRFGRPDVIWASPDCTTFPQFRPMCKNGDPCHARAPRGAKTGTQGLKNSKERSVIPASLCEHIVWICERQINKEDK